MRILSSVILEVENAFMTEFPLNFFRFSKAIKVFSFFFFHAEAMTILLQTNKINVINSESLTFKNLYLI